MAKDHINLKDRKHPLVKSFQDFYEGLEEIVGRESLQLGEFHQVNEGPLNPEYRLRGKDDQTGYLKITGRDNNYKQDFYVNMTPQNSADLKEFLKRYDAFP